MLNNIAISSNVFFVDMPLVVVVCEPTDKKKFIRVNDVRMQ